MKMNCKKPSSSSAGAGAGVAVAARTPPRSNNRCYLSLACSIGSMSLACGSLLQIPNTTDRISLQRGLFLTSLGFIYFVSLTDFCNKYLLETPHGLQFRKKYRLMMSDVLEITNKVVSAIQASFSFLVGFIVCKSTCSKSFVYASHFLMEAYGWFGTAYFMYDIWSMYKVHTQKISDKLKLMRLSTSRSANPLLLSSMSPSTSMSSSSSLSSSSSSSLLSVASSSTLLSVSNGKSNNGHHAAFNSGLYDKAANNKFLIANGNAASNGRSDKEANGIDGITTNGEIHLRQHEDEIYDYDGETVQIPKDGKWDFLKYVLTHPVMMIHHVFIGTFGLLVVTYIRGGGHCIYSYMFMMEFSTPFVSLRSILSTMGLKESRTYIINGLIMLGSFFVCRVFMWPYVMWRYSIAIDATLWQAMAGLPRGCIISISILFLPQIYWFFLMVKGALKVFFPGKSRKPQSKQQNEKVMTNGKKKNALSYMPNDTAAGNAMKNSELANDKNVSCNGDVGGGDRNDVNDIDLINE